MDSRPVVKKPDEQTTVPTEHKSQNISLTGTKTSYIEIKKTLLMPLAPNVLAAVISEVKTIKKEEVLNCNIDDVKGAEQDVKKIINESNTILDQSAQSFRHDYPLGLKLFFMSAMVQKIEGLFKAQQTNLPVSFSKISVFARHAQNTVTPGTREVREIEVSKPAQGEITSFNRPFTPSRTLGH